MTRTSVSTILKSRCAKSRCARSSSNAGGDASVVLNAVAEGKGNYGFNAASV